MRILIKCVYLCFLSACICVTGCIVTKVHTMPVTKYNASYDLVWDNLVKYLGKEKEPILVSDKEKGVISTDWVNMHKAFSVKRYRYDIQLTKLGENEVQVGIASPQEAYSMGDWEEILPSERRAGRIFWYLRGKIRKTLGISKLSKRPFNKKYIGLMRD